MKVLKFQVATIKGNTESRRAGTGLLEKILNNTEAACNEVVKHGGLDAVLEACKSQDVETQRSSALALLNLSLYGGQFNQNRMIKQRAQGKDRVLVVKFLFIVAQRT